MKSSLCWLFAFVLFLSGCNGITPTVPTNTPVHTPTAVWTETATVSPTPEHQDTYVPIIIGGPAASPTATATSTPEALTRFAVIGDYGAGGKAEADVAALVIGWQPEFIITTGDNNYPHGSAETIDAHIGQFYHMFIHPYKGQFGEGADQNRFFPTLGNHDWTTDNARPYLDYFTLPGNERYYDFVWGSLHFFALDGDPREPDGVKRDSRQAAWLQEQLAASTRPWRIVYMHQPPYSSGLHGSVTWMRWPFKEWGASVVLAGHDHVYERLSIDGLTYFVNGLGGGPIYRFGKVLEGSQVRYNQDYGAILVEANSQVITFQFVTRQGEVVDTYSLAKTP